MESYTVTWRDAHVEICSNSIWFTAYAGDGRVLGTITRPHVGHKKWQAHRPCGAAVGEFIGPKSALIALGQAYWA
jgi:hypothetical protein